MKKTATIIILFVMALSLLSGCFMFPKKFAGPSETSQSGSSLDAQATGGVNASMAPAKNPSQGYSNYITMKSNAAERITDASEKTDALTAAVSMNMLGISMVDISLVTLTMLSDDLKSSELALGMLGMKDVKISGSGNDYTIAYSDANGATIKQTCKYDVGKDQLSALLYDSNGELSMYFEYVKVGVGYAAQYYFISNDSYQVIRAYFDKDNIAAFGMMSAAEEPASIIGKTGLSEDFVKNSETYMILKDGKLTVFNKGATSTN